MAAYYNEFDPFAAAWLRELIKAGHIADGDVDERSIKEVAGADLRGFAQVHFFAGIGGWSYALRLAGWPDHRPVWTGSCPCQPFSAAGGGKGEADERHLWPDFRRLITECSPSIVFGEQVASADGRIWLSGVRVDLEALAYEVGTADLCAAGVGSPNIRQRLYWLADIGASGRGALQRPTSTHRGSEVESNRHGDVGGVADTDGRLAGDGYLQSGRQHGQQPQDGGASNRLGHASNPGLPFGSIADDEQGIVRLEGNATAAPGAWSGAVHIACSDGKTRRIEPSIFPLAHGVSNRVGTLRGAGNAINPILAKEFIQAADEAMTFL